MKMVSRMKKNIIIKTLLVIIAIFFNYEFLYRFGNFDVSLMGLNFNISLLILYVLSIVKSKNNIKTSKSEKVISVLFTIFMIIGEIISVTGNIVYLVKLKYIWLTIIKVLGFRYLFDSIISFINGDSKEAFSNFSEAAKKGDIISRYILGVLYSVGAGIEHNMENAKKCFSNAIAEGYDLSVIGNEWILQLEKSKMNNEP